MNGAPEIQMNKPEQIPALPLGARIKVDPWTNQLSLVKGHKIEGLSAPEKQPFEITPMFVHLTRYSENAAPPAGTSTGAQAKPVNVPLAISSAVQYPKVR
jgi:hypothetical protein